jgi:hypothetical protein
MLLNHDRVWEGAWALYSFRAFSGKAGKIVVHDDGTLDGEDVSLLKSLFPDIKIWPRTVADALCESRLRELGLESLLCFRNQSILALKLIDPVLLGESRSIILMDSDVLFYKAPVELLEAACRDEAAYSVCCCYCYCTSEEQLEQILGRRPSSLVNSGLLTVDRTKIDLRKLDNYLAAPEFWNSDGSVQYFAEQTLWACEMTRLGAVPLPDSYAICPLEPSTVHFGHYCGGGSSFSIRFYNSGLPYLRKQFQV